MIDKNASTPMYEQIAAVLRREILQKKYGERGGNQHQQTNCNTFSFHFRLFFRKKQYRPRV